MGPDAVEHLPGQVLRLQHLEDAEALLAVQPFAVDVDRKRILTGVARSAGMKVEFRYDFCYPPTANHPRSVAFLTETVGRLAGDSRSFRQASVRMGAEDFSYILERVPGAMMFLGACEEGDGSPEPCHSNKMRLDEGAMATGIALHAAVAIRYLEEAAERCAS